MFSWVKTLLRAQPQPVQDNDVVFAETIAQIQTCRKHLVLLIEEARTARQLLDVSEIALQRAHREAKRELYIELHGENLTDNLPPLEPEIFTSDRRQR